MKSTVSNSQSGPRSAPLATPEQIEALELAVEHWGDLTPTQRTNAFRCAFELVPAERRKDAMGLFLAVYLEHAETGSPH